MFTGIIEELGTIAHMDRRPDSIRLTIQAHKVLEGTQLGDSIAVNGVCLTVTDMTDSTFSADVMHETMRRSSFSTIKSGSQVNLERAMQVGGRLGGHIVSGHIDGISLTVVSVGSSQFSVSIIPHTMANTTLMDKHPGAIVNLETDVIGKYVHSFTVGHPSSASSGLTMEKLLENGF